MLDHICICIYIQHKRSKNNAVIRTWHPQKKHHGDAEKNIHTVEDLLRCFPRKYRDYREVRDILDCPDSEYAAVSGRLMKVQVKQGAKGAYLRLSFLSDRSKHGDGTDVWFRADLFVSRYARYLEKKYSEEYLKKDVVVTGK